MKKILKNFSVLLTSILFIFFGMTTLNAASATISVSSSSSTVVVGNTFTVTIKVSSSSPLGSWEFTPSYDSSKVKMTSGDSSVVSYGDGSTKSKSYTYKFKAVGTGSTKISVKSYGVIDYNSESKMSVNAGSKTIKIISKAEQQASLSKNNDLKGLWVEGFKLNPEFNKNTTNYTVEAGANTTSVYVGATEEDSKASVSGNGTHDVEEGENKFVIKVTAQNGSEKTYTVVVNVKDPNPISVTIGDKDYVVVKRENKLPVIEYFDKATVEIGEQKVPGFYNELNNYTLVGLKDSEGNVSLFKYDKETGEYSKYEDVTLEEIKLIPLSFTKKLDASYKKAKLTIGETLFEAFKKNNSKIYLIHARNFNTGKDDYYEYDEETKSIIKYSDDKENQLLKKKIKNYEKIIMLLLGETVIIVIVLIGILISKVRKNKIKRKKLKEKMEEEKKKSIEEKNEIKEIEPIKIKEIKEPKTNEEPKKEKKEKKKNKKKEEM